MMMFPRVIRPKILDPRVKYEVSPLADRYDFPVRFPLYLANDGTLLDEPHYVYLNYDFTAYRDEQMTQPLTRAKSFWLYWLLDGFMAKILNNLDLFYSDTELFVHRYMLDYGIRTVSPEKALETMDHDYVNP